MQPSTDVQTFQFGQLKRVNLRQVWVDEEKGFTPWLAENLHFLSDALGLELVLESREISVGTYRADILARDTQTDTWVLIENQLQRTDHCHLGQIITYAAGLKASTVIWIAEECTEEHIAALDWLNSISDDSVRFFALQIELWSIGNVIAPQFNILSRPNSWIRQGKNYKAAVHSSSFYTRDFDRRQFIIDCLTTNPGITGADIQRKAWEIHSQSISAAHISEVRKQYNEQRMQVVQ